MNHFEKKHEELKERLAELGVLDDDSATGQSGQNRQKGQSVYSPSKNRNSRLRKRPLLSGGQDFS